MQISQLNCRLLGIALTIQKTLIRFSSEAPVGEWGNWGIIHQRFAAYIWRAVRSIREINNKCFFSWSLRDYRFIPTMTYSRENENWQNADKIEKNLGLEARFGSFQLIS